ncbi:MAG: hypothetical protein ACKVPX_06370 [Myxococcaceae bacterium]
MHTSYASWTAATTQGPYGEPTRPACEKQRSWACRPPVAQPSVIQLALELDRLFAQMIAHQRSKVLRLAREVEPRLGPDDVLNPHDFPALKAHPTFEYEDGHLAGLIAAQAAVRAQLRPYQSPPSQSPEDA